MNIFSHVKMGRPKLNKFNLSHEKKLTMRMGEIVPIFCQETLPGDVFRVKSEMFMRLMPLVAPMMHRVNVKVDWFFVPNRLTWKATDSDGWEDFITGGADGTLAPEAPWFEINVGNRDTTEPGTLMDYLGVPDLRDNTEFPSPWAQNVGISALPFRAYQLIWNEYYRDQNLQQPIPVALTAGEVTGASVTDITTIRKSCWEKDPFTGALPFTQRGAPVTLPVTLSGYAPVTAEPLDPGTVSSTVSGIEQPGSTNVGYGIDVTDPNVPAGSELYARLADGVATAVTIEGLRFAARLQEWLEKNARGGARYIEQMLVHFGVVSDDARLQRPEYLGGSSSPFNISEVLSTSQSIEVDNEYPLGDMAGRGVSAGAYNGFKRRFKEHGFVLGLCRVIPRTGYQQGLPRYLGARTSKFEYFFPEFAHLGEQAVKLREVYCQPGTLTDDFGYVPRYYEYKMGFSTTHGEMKTSLAHWHMNRIFAAGDAANPIPTVLNGAFVECNPTKRVFSVLDDGGNNHEVVCQLYNRVDALRPMPVFGIPRL